jgi:peptidoglycan/xylan/chitin deacetylase (PgdA/CDA1 family)
MHTVSLLFHDVFVAGPHESGFQSPAADRYKLSSADFDAQLDGMATITPACPFVITVDDGGVSYYTLVADRLEARGWRGYCFVPTNMIGRRGFLDCAQIRELDARGHVIGSHSASHPARLSACSNDEIDLEWARSRQVLEDVLGHAVVAASVPGGYYSRRVARAAHAAGLQLLFTSEPATSIHRECGIETRGRFTIRHGHPPDTARRLLLPAPWARFGAWASWNAKGLVKPLLGSSYIRVAHWIHAR